MSMAANRQRERAGPPAAQPMCGCWGRESRKFRGLKGLRGFAVLELLFCFPRLLSTSGCAAWDLAISCLAGPSGHGYLRRTRSSFSQDQTPELGVWAATCGVGVKEPCLPGPRLTLGTRLTQVASLRDQGHRTNLLLAARTHQHQLGCVECPIPRAAGDPRKHLIGPPAFISR